jgi:hypothetical protein
MQNKLTTDADVTFVGFLTCDSTTDVHVPDTLPHLVHLTCDDLITVTDVIPWLNTHVGDRWVNWSWHAPKTISFAHEPDAVQFALAFT